MLSYEMPFSMKFRQTDMAGIGYFNEVFNIFHDGYEEWAEELCGSKSTWFGNPEWAVPIKKIECEYSLPLIAFEKYSLRISVSSVGTSSSTLKSQIFKQQIVCCEIVSTHVFMNKKTLQSFPIPEDYLLKLKV
jgi:1,4-dihydroxy-2-naphthoyl-CoA hydrolase